MLQLLVLSQEQERKHLVKLVHGVSLEDWQRAACTVPPKEGESIVFLPLFAACLSEFFFFCFSSCLYSLFPVSYAESNKQAALRNGCIKRLREIHASLQAHSETQTPLEQANPHIQLQSDAQPQIQPRMNSELAMRSQHQLKDYTLLLLTHLLELQEAQASALLRELMDMVSQDNHSSHVNENIAILNFFFFFFKSKSVKTMCLLECAASPSSASQV